MVLLTEKQLRTIWALRSGKRKARENEFEAGAFRNPGVATARFWWPLLLMAPAEQAPAP